MRKKGIKKKPPKRIKEVHGRVKAGTAECNKIIDKICFRPLTQTWGELAAEIGFSHNALVSFRHKYADAIEQRLREWWIEARPAIDRATLESCTGFKSVNENADGGKSTKQYPPNSQSLLLFYDRCEKFLDKKADERIDVLYGIEPQMHQILPLFHWDKHWGVGGHDQLVAWFSGRGGGKTKIGARKILRLAKINRGVSGLVCAPTYKMLSNPVQEYLLAAIEECKIPYKFRKQDNYIELWGDTRLICRSFEEPDKIRGLEVGYAWIDELREGEKYTLDTILACVRDPQATLRQIFITTTPNGYDFMWDIWGDPDSKLLKSGRAVSYFSRTQDNLYLPASFIDLLMETYDEQVIKQEVLGQFVNIASAQIYYNFNRSIHVGEYPYDPNLPIHIGHDFNVDPLTAIIFQIRTERNHKIVTVVDEVYIEGSSTDEICKELKTRGYDPSRFSPEWIANYPDASGSRRSTERGSMSNIEILKQHGFTNLKHPRVNCLVRDRYAAVNGLLRNANGVSRLFIDKKCRHLIRDLEQEVYKPGTNQRDDSTVESKKRGHITDALGYGVHYLFRIENSFTAYPSF